MSKLLRVKTIMVFILVLVVISFGWYYLEKKTLYKIRVSFPPNNCDLKIGYVDFGVTFYDREKCLKEKAVASQNEKYCYSIYDDRFFNSCLFKVAEVKRMPEICDQSSPIRVSEINGYVYRYSYKEACLREVALHWNDLSICDLITDKTLGGSEACKGIITARKTE